METPETQSAPIEGMGLDVDPMFYLRVIYRRKWMVLGVLATVVLLVGIWVLRQPKVYEATTSVIIDISAPRFLDNENSKDVVDNGASNYWYTEDYYQTQYKVVQSHAVAQRVVDKLGLQGDASFLGLDKIKDLEKRAKIMRETDAASVLQGKIRVEPVKNSHLIYVHVDDVDPKRAALLSNEVAEAYKDENLNLKLKVTETAQKWLEDRLESLTSEAKKSELAVYEFKKDKDMLSTSLEDHLSMVSQRLNTYNQALTDVKTKIAGLRARVEAISQAREGAEKGQQHWAEALPLEGVESNLVQQLKLHYAAQKGECAELVDRYGPEHPKLIACEDKEKSAEQDLLHELDNVVKSAKLELNEAVAKEKNLNDLVEATKQEAFDVNKKQIEFDRLKRESDNDQRLQELVLKRLKDIELSGLIRTSNVRVLDPAQEPHRPAKPNIPLSLALAMVVGLLGGFGLAFAVEFLDTTIVTQDQVERWLSVTFLGILPRFARSKDGALEELIVHTQPKSAVAECCRSVRTNLLFMSPDKPLRSLLITSSGPQDGKTTTAVSLAIALAESGKKVLLVDADMRKPRVHRVFNVGNGMGLSSLILGEGKLADAVKTTDVPGLSVLTCGPVPPNPAELLHTESFSTLLATLREKYDLLVVDSPPVGAVADAAVLATQVDGTVFVLKAGSTSRDHARRAVRALNDVNARVFGAILNDLDLDDRRYGSYYYYYYSRYGYYGAENKPAAP